MQLVPSRLRPCANERGIVLAAALLFVLLTSVLVMTLMLTTTGERTQSSNVQTAKLSLYAADAGIRTQQQLLANLAKAKVDSCLTLWNLTQNPLVPIISNPSQLFPAGTLAGTWAASSTNPSFNASASISFADAASGPASQTYDYTFTITSSGSLSNTGKRNVQSTGVLRVSASRGSFSDYLVLTDEFKTPNNVPAWFTTTDVFDGRVHTNASFRFAYNPTFQDRVTQVGANAIFYNNGGSAVTVDANNNGVIDVPNFYGGYLRSQGSIALPSNPNDQQAAALGLTPNGTPPTSTQINTQLGLGAGTPPNGPYLVHTGNALTGGIYVQGTANKVKVWADTSNDLQYYQIGVGAAHMTMEIDRAASVTKVWDSNGMGGSPDHIYTGFPNGVLFTNGGINQLTGPPRNGSNVDAAIALNHRVLICATGDIAIQGDLTCDQFENKTNVLGIYSSGGAVLVGASAPANLFVDAFVMACGATTGQFAVENFDSGLSRGTMTLRGGVVTKYYGQFSTTDANGNVLTGFRRSFQYDRRGLVPPFYPSSNKFTADTPSARTVAWKEI